MMRSVTSIPTGIGHETNHYNQDHLGQMKEFNPLMHSRLVLTAEPSPVRAVLGPGPEARCHSVVSGTKKLQERASSGSLQTGCGQRHAAEERELGGGVELSENT
ncbi:hypothetical protein EYF80_041612 [Liparis tanakae]|uniref:Uncharacterized protein n=1 Tax=Liparis tanakae TaxID=230148 RepID=A0A4Z2G4X6_9TELE|nr:hypothetical protein EYF80_041612 [Liparis tanakae]